MLPAGDIPAINLVVAVLGVDKESGFTGFIPIVVGGGTGVATTGLGGADVAPGAGAVKWSEKMLLKWFQIIKYQFL